MESDRELFLIDGNSLAYRAFFALPDTIATSRGEPTNAIFGFASMLVKILTEYGPKPTIVVWDAGMSGREQRYERTTLCLERLAETALGQVALHGIFRTAMHEACAVNPDALHSAPRATTLIARVVEAILE